MADMSDLDSLYFIDEYVYNCPFCRRRNVHYQVGYRQAFDWTPEKQCFVYFVRCASCSKVSLHLTFANIHLEGVYYDDNGFRHRFAKQTDIPLDESFFYSVPTSLFAVDSRIPRILRELLTEAEGCLKSNFLTGASACARKIVYELARLHQAQGDDYVARIKSLKERLPEVEPTYFDTLITIQELTSEKVHEASYDGWQAVHLRLILAALNEALAEIYVIPKMRQEKREAILALKDKLSVRKRATKEESGAPKEDPQQEVPPGKS